MKKKLKKAKTNARLTLTWEKINNGNFNSQLRNDWM